MPSDNPSIDIRDINKQDETVTKRKILSDVHNLFYPTHYTSPVTLFPKILLRVLWKKKITWESELPTSIAQKFQKWRKQLSSLKDIAVSRYLREDPYNSGDLSLHVFCDASKTAYAICIYIYEMKTENQHHVN